jgi:hypothetical protein
MKTITVPKLPRLFGYLPILILGLIGMWNYRKYDYSIKAIMNGTFHAYLRMRKGYKGTNKEKRIKQVMLFAKHNLLLNNKSITK